MCAGGGPRLRRRARASPLRGRTAETSCAGRAVAVHGRPGPGERIVGTRRCARVSSCVRGAVWVPHTEFLPFSMFPKVACVASVPPPTCRLGFSSPRRLLGPPAFVLLLCPSREIAADVGPWLGGLAVILSVRPGGKLVTPRSYRHRDFAVVAMALSGFADTLYSRHASVSDTGM